MAKETETSLSIITETSLPQISLNFDELKQKALQIVSEYENIAITEDSYKSAKRDAKSLAGYVREVEEKRKEIKRTLTKPIEEFDKKCKDLETVFQDAKSKIEKQTEIFDEQRRQEKQNKAEKYIKDAIKKFEIPNEYAGRIVLKADYTNLTATLKSIKADIEAQATAIVKEISLKKEIQLVLNERVETENNNISQKLTVGEGMLSSININKAVEEIIGGKDKDSVINALKDNISTIANKVRKNEEEIREKERLKVEAEAKKKAEAMVANSTTPQANSAPNAEKPAPSSDVDFTDILGIAENSEQTKEVPKSSVSLNGFEIPGFDDIIGIPTPPKYLMSVMFRGEFDKLKELGEELKVLCRKYSCEMKVEADRSGKITGDTWTK